MVVHNQVQFSIEVEVRRHQSDHSGARRRIDVRLKGAVPVSEENGDHTRAARADARNGIGRRQVEMPIPIEVTEDQAVRVRTGRVVDVRAEGSVSVPQQNGDQTWRAGVGQAHLVEHRQVKVAVAVEIRRRCRDRLNSYRVPHAQVAEAPVRLAELEGDGTILVRDRHQVRNSIAIEVPGRCQRAGVARGEIVSAVNVDQRTMLRAEGCGEGEKKNDADHRG